MTNRTLSERLRDSARSVARASQVIADAKIKRNVAAGEPDANYSGLKPEQTVEWKAADALDEAARVLEEIRGVVAEYAKIYRTKKVALGAYQACADVDKRARAALANLKAAKEKDKSHG